MATFPLEDIEPCEKTGKFLRLTENIYFNVFVKRRQTIEKGNAVEILK